LKDLIVKTKSMAGHYAPYVPGWDCTACRSKRASRKRIGRQGKSRAAEFLQALPAIAGRFIEQHKKDFKRLEFSVAGMIPT
jgi:isoleucyl-tRNA synthetase